MSYWVNNCHESQKNNIFYIHLLMFFIVLSCGKKDSYPPYYYTLQIRFTDQFGNDKVQGIKYIEDNKPGSSDEYKVQKDIYRLEVEQTHKPKEDLLRVQKVEPYNYLIIRTSTLPSPDYRPKHLAHRLVCAHVFGDEEEHTIVSDWEKVGSSDKCISITVDGKTFTSTENDQYGNFPIFLVSLDE